MKCYFKIFKSKADLFFIEMLKEFIKIGLDFI